MIQPTFKKTNLPSYLWREIPYRSLVRLALYFAEDVFHLNDEYTTNPSKKLIDLIKKCLRKDKVKKKLKTLIKNHSFGVSTDSSANAAYAAAYSAARVAFLVEKNSNYNNEIVNSTIHAFSWALDAKFKINTRSDCGLAVPTEGKRGTNEYLIIANSLRTKLEINENLSHFLSKDVASIAALVDYLNENYNINLVKSLPKGGFKFNLKGYNVIGQTYPELLQNIINNKAVWLWLSCMFLDKTG